VKAAGFAFAITYFVFGYAVLEAAAQLVVLGSRAYRQRKDTPYYGAALGLGFGAMASLQMCALSLERTGVLERGLTLENLGGFLLIVLMSAGISLTHGAAGVWIGKGSADGKLWRGLIHGALWQAPTLLLLWFWLQAPFQAALEPALLAVTYGAFALVFTQNKVLDRIVPPELRDLVRKERRRDLRRQGRDNEGAGEDEPLVSSPLDPPPR
jgi:hypothetical protein